MTETDVTTLSTTGCRVKRRTIFTSNVTFSFACGLVPYSDSLCFMIFGGAHSSSIRAWVEWSLMAPALRDAREQSQTDTVLTALKQSKSVPASQNECQYIAANHRQMETRRSGDALPFLRAANVGAQTVPGQATTWIGGPSRKS